MAINSLAQNILSFEEIQKKLQELYKQNTLLQIGHQARKEAIQDHLDERADLYFQTHLDEKRNGHKIMKVFMDGQLEEFRIANSTKGIIKDKSIEELKALNLAHRKKRDGLLTYLYVKGQTIEQLVDLLKDYHDFDFVQIKGSRISEVIGQYTGQEMTVFVNQQIEEEIVALYADALYPNIRFDQHYRKMAVIVVIGISKEGKLIPLAICPHLTEANETYSAVFENLIQRGLNLPGVIITDAHMAIEKAIKENFPGAIWIRCSFHLFNDILRALPKNQEKEVLDRFIDSLREILFTCENKDEAYQKAKEFIDAYKELYPEAIKIFENGYQDALAYYDFSGIDSSCFRTSNILERINGMIRARTKRSVSFPSVESFLKVIIPYLNEQIKKKMYKEYINPEELEKALQEHQDSLMSLLGNISETLKNFEDDLNDPETGFLVQLLETQDPSCLNFALEDPEELKKDQGGVLQSASKGYFAYHNGRRVNTLINTAINIDDQGFPHAFMINLSLNNNTEIWTKGLAKFYNQAQISPRLIVLNKLTQPDEQLYEQYFPDSLLQKDSTTIINRCESLIPNGNKEYVCEKLKTIINHSQDLTTFERDFNLFLDELKDLNLEAFNYLQTEEVHLKSAFIVSPHQPVGKMLRTSAVESIFELAEQRLVKNKIPTVEELCRALLYAAQEFNQKWLGQNKRHAINPIHYSQSEYNEINSEPIKKVDRELIMLEKASKAPIQLPQLPL